MSPGRALVTGATGFIGQHLVGRLLETGLPVRVLTRGHRPIPEAWAGRVEVVRGDLSAADRLTCAVTGCEIVYHLAAALRNVDDMRAVNVDGTRRLLTACDAARVRHVVLLSSVGVMGATGQGCVDEHAAGGPPVGSYEASKLAAERQALAWSDSVGIGLTALRPTIVFGEGPRPAFDSLLAWLRAIRDGLFVWFDREAVANYVYAGDVAGSCLAAAAGRVRGPVIVADSCPLTEFVAACARALGVAVPRRAVPRLVGYSAAALMERLLPASPLTTARVRALCNRTLFRSTRSAELGDQSPIGWREGVARTVAWYQARGAL